MQLESIAPSHRAFPALDKAVKNLVEISSCIMAYGNHRAVYKADSRTPTKGIDSHKSHHLEEYAGQKLHETIVGHGGGKITAQTLPDKEQIIMLEIMERPKMIAQKNSPNLTLGHTSLTMTKVSILLVRGRSIWRLLLKSVSKFLQNSSIIQKISVTLSMVIIAYIFCN